jgi:hypothetical protein
MPSSAPVLACQVWHSRGVAGQRQRQSRLQGLLTDLGRKAAGARPPSPRLDTLPTEAAERVLDLYRELGGAAESMVVFRPGVWDIVLADGSLVELDEEQHFNRYRRMSLQPSWALSLPWADSYLRYCDEYETACLRKANRGGYWASPSTERMFGPADPPGIFERSGSPRWKQRALYDAMRDALAAAGVVRLSRVAVWDELGDTTLARVLDGRAEADHEALAELVALRST